MASRPGLEMGSFMPESLAYVGKLAARCLFTFFSKRPAVVYSVFIGLVVVCGILIGPAIVYSVFIGPAVAPPAVFVVVPCVPQHERLFVRSSLTLNGAVDARVHTGDKPQMRASNGNMYLLHGGDDSFCPACCVWRVVCQ